MGKALLALLGSGVILPIIGATVRHYWIQHLENRKPK